MLLCKIKGINNKMGKSPHYKQIYKIKKIVNCKTYGAVDSNYHMN